MTILETQRLSLREFSADDVDALANVLSDPKRCDSTPRPLTRQELKAGSRATVGAMPEMATACGQWF